MKKALLPLLFAVLAACGYKGDLYLPKEGDNNRFGVFQIGIPETASAPQPEQPQNTPKSHEHSAQ